MGQVTIIAVFPHLIILSSICNFRFKTSCDYLRLFVIAGSITTLVAAFVKKLAVAVLCEPRKCQKHGRLLPPRAFSFSPNTMSDLSNCEYETGLADFFEAFLWGEKKKKKSGKAGICKCKMNRELLVGTFWKRSKLSFLNRLSLQLAVTLVSVFLIMFIVPSVVAVCAYTTSSKN